jgi:ATP-dependent RNA helicase DHX8/PRP22
LEKCAIFVFDFFRLISFNCHEISFKANSMRKAQDIRKQLATIMERYKQDIVSCGNDFQKVSQCIAAGYFRHAARCSRWL